MKITPLRLSILYLLFAVVWIWLAVPALSKLTGTTMGPASGQMMGKVLFVLLSTSIFYVALSWYGNHVKQARSQSTSKDDEKEPEKVGIWDWSRSRGKLFIDDEWASILGYSKTELEPLDYDTWTDLIHPEDLQKTELLMEMHHTRHYPRSEEHTSELQS